MTCKHTCPIKGECEFHNIGKSCSYCAGSTGDDVIANSKHW